MELVNLEEVEFLNEIKFIGDRVFVNSFKLKLIKFSEVLELEVINISVFVNINLENVILFKKFFLIFLYVFVNIKNDKFLLVFNLWLDNGSKFNIG